METVPNSLFPHPLPADDIKAAWEHLRLEYRVQKSKVAPDQEIVTSVFLFGGQEIEAATIGYTDPNLLVVRGRLGKNGITAYIHQSCLQVVFSVVPKNEKAQRQPVGFRNPEPFQQESPSE